MEKITRKHWKSLTKQVMFKLDLTVCRQHWMRACLSPNRAPGQTVVPFSQFTTALVYAKRWKKGDMKAAAICKAIMSTAFPFQHKAGVEYNPLPRGTGRQRPSVHLRGHYQGAHRADG